MLTDLYATRLLWCSSCKDDNIQQDLQQVETQLAQKQWWLTNKQEKPVNKDKDQNKHRWSRCIKSVTTALDTRPNIWQIRRAQDNASTASQANKKYHENAHAELYFGVFHSISQISLDAFPSPKEEFYIFTYFTKNINYIFNIFTIIFIKAWKETGGDWPLLWCWGWQWSPPTRTAGFWWWLTYPVGPLGCHGATSCLSLVSAYHTHTSVHTEMKIVPVPCVCESHVYHVKHRIHQIVSVSCVCASNSCHVWNKHDQIVSVLVSASHALNRYETERMNTCLSTCLSLTFAYQTHNIQQTQTLQSRFGKCITYPKPDCIWCMMMCRVEKLPLWNQHWQGRLL